MRISIQKNSDWWGMISSALCLIHCMAIPVMMSLLPLFAPGEWHEAWHLMDYFFITLSGVAVYYSLHAHTPRQVKASFIAAWLLFSLGLVLHERWLMATLVSYTGSLMLIMTHWYNLRYCRRSSCSR